MRCGERIPGEGSWRYLRNLIRIDHYTWTLFKIHYFSLSYSEFVRDSSFYLLNISALALDSENKSRKRG
jgi:hypothetical protein